MEFVDNFTELEVYKLARVLAREVFEITKKFPREEMYSLTDQFRRASRSIGGQIGEAWGKRRFIKHFVSKLTDSDAEQFETQHWIGTSLDCAYITTAIADDLLQKCYSINKMLNTMILKAPTFCEKSTRNKKRS